MVRQPLASLMLCIAFGLSACGGGGGGGDDAPPPSPPVDPQVSGLDARPSNTTCLAPAFPSTLPNAIDLVDPFPNLMGVSFPLGMFQLPEDDRFFYVIERDGRVLRFDNSPSATTTTTVLDISAQVSTFSEGGLLGLAFHPDVADNGVVYLSYTTDSPFRSRVSRFRMTNLATIDPASEQVILEIAQPAGNHNGGDIGFGPDGFFYFGLGDGGGANDQFGNGQNLQTLLGSMLRIDVDPTTNSAPFYTIPADNPFINNPNARDEIYAYGLRNPFRWSFDTETGVLWLADVGQNRLEEVDQIILGGNYGWPILEGSECFGGGDCDRDGLILPVDEYGRDLGRSITGGYVYRGSESPSLFGSYFFADFSSRNIWTLVEENGVFTRRLVAVGPDSAGIVAFAQDNAGEVYVLQAFPNDGRAIRKVAVSDAPPAAANIPTQLSSSGCFNPSNPIEPGDGLIRFDVINPLWSDGTEKERFIALPNGETVGVDALGDFDFPTGTVLAKHFANNNTMVETRLLMLHESGWQGYSYEWNSEQTDAFLLEEGKSIDVAGLTDYRFPSGAECRQCHTQIKNFALAPEVLQLNRDFTYPSTGRSANQIDTLNAIGVFTQAPAAALDDARLFALDDNNASLEQRAKSYLHSNCSQCHQPGGIGEGNFDLRFETPFAQMNLCNIAPNDPLDLMDPRYIVPGDSSRSMLLERITRLDSARMPPLATSAVDTQAVDVIEQWIDGMDSCP